MLRFSSTVRSRSLVRAWGITPMARRAASASFCTSCPATQAVPAVMGMRVVIMRISVDLPAPLGPSRPKISSSLTLKDTSSTAVNSPYFLTMCFTSMALGTAGAPLSSAPFVPPLDLKSVIIDSSRRLRRCSCPACHSLVPARPTLRRSFLEHKHPWDYPNGFLRSEEHTSELQSQSNLVCRLLLEKKKKN